MQQPPQQAPFGPQQAFEPQQHQYQQQTAQGRFLRPDLTQQSVPQQSQQQSLHQPNDPAAFVQQQQTFGHQGPSTQQAAFPNPQAQHHGQSFQAPPGDADIPAPVPQSPSQISMKPLGGDGSGQADADGAAASSRRIKRKKRTK